MSFCGSELLNKLAVHVPSLSVAVWLPTVEGLHVASLVGVVTVVLPSACLKSNFFFAKEFCIIGIILAPKTSSDAIAANTAIVRSFDILGSRLCV